MVSLNLNRNFQNCLESGNRFFIFQLETLKDWNQECQAVTFRVKNSTEKQNINKRKLKIITQIMYLKMKDLEILIKLEVAIKSVFCFFILIFFLSCTRYFLEENKETKIRLPSTKIDIAYEFVGWEQDEYRKNAADVLTTLHTSQYFGKIASAVKSSIENRIQIILISEQNSKPFFGEQSEPVSWMIEKKPGKTLITVLNRMLSIRSFFILPYFTQNDTQLTFRHWKGNHLLHEYTYSLKNLLIVGWVSLFARPFDDQAQVESMYSDATKRFISDFHSQNQ